MSGLCFKHCVEMVNAAVTLGWAGLLAGFLVVHWLLVPAVPGLISAGTWRTGTSNDYTASTPVTQLI